MASTPTMPRTPSARGFSNPGSPLPLGSPLNMDETVPQQLQHLATQIVTQTVSSRAQLKTFAEQIHQLAAKQDELLAFARAEEARRQNRVRSLADQPLLPVIRPGHETPAGLPPITSQNALGKMSTADLTAWYAYYTSSRPDLPRSALEGALAAEVGLVAPPPSYTQALASTPSPSSAPAPAPTPTSTPSKLAAAPTPTTVAKSNGGAGKPTVTLSPTAVKWGVIFALIAGLLGMSVRYSDNGSVQNILQQFVQILGQYILKSGLFVYQSSLRLLEQAEDVGADWLQRVPPLNPFLNNENNPSEFKTQVI